MKYLLILLAIVTSHTVFSQKWELAKNKNGIKVYTAKDAQSGFKLAKVEAVIPGDLDQLEKILLDPSTNRKWIYRTKECYLIKRGSSHEIIGYTRTSLPWPASDRDLVIKTTVTRTGETSLNLVASDVPGSIAVKKGVVRVSDFYNTWNVKSDGKGSLTIDYFLKLNPGGDLPVWMVNMFVAKGPYETFSRLSELLK